MPADSRAKIALKLDGTAFGAAVAGPLGALCGGAISDFFESDLAKSVVKATLNSGLFTEVAGGYCYDKLRELTNGSPPKAPMEAAMKAALQQALRDMRGSAQDGESEWFSNWDTRLASANPLDLSGCRELPIHFAATSGNEPSVHETARVELVSALLERLDLEQRVASQGGVPSINLAARTMPSVLRARIASELDGHLNTALDHVFSNDGHKAAWVGYQRTFQATVMHRFDRVDQANTITHERLDEILRRLNETSPEAVARLEAEVAARTAETEQANQEKAELVKKLYDLEQRFGRSGGAEDVEIQAWLSAGEFEQAGEILDRRLAASKAQQAQDHFDRARVYDLQFRPQDAMRHYAEAWRLAEGLLDKRRRDIGWAYALVLHRQNRHGQAIEIWTRLLEANDLTEADRAALLNNRAALYALTQRLREADADFTEALEVFWSLAESNPEAYRPYVATTLNNRADLYSDTQRLREAEADYIEALEIRRSLAESNPEAYRPDVAMTLNNTATLYAQTQRLREAEADATEALQILEPMHRAQPEFHGDQLARILLLLAVLKRVRGGQEAEVHALARRALEAAYDPGLRAAAEGMLET